MKNNNQIDIPLVFFSFAFLIVVFGLFSKFAFQNTNSFSKAQQNTPLPLKNTVPSQALNYSRPILCDYRTKDSSISAFIDTTNSTAVSVAHKTSIQKYIVQADCLYSWGVKDTKGTKKCGVGNYIALGKQLLGSGMGSVDSLTSMFSKSSSEMSSVDFQAVFKTCKNVGEIKKEVFTVPKGIKFE